MLNNFTQSGAWTGLGDLGGFLPAAERSKHLRRREQALTEASAIWRGWQEGRIDQSLMLAAINPGRASDFAREYLGRHYSAIFNETMGLADFSALTADILDRAVYGRFSQYPQTWREICRVVPLRDLRTVKRFEMNGVEAPYTQVAEFAPHTMQKLAQTPYTYQPYKYLSGTEPISWEAVVNDDLGIFNDLPERLSIGGLRAISKFVTSLYIGTTGPDSTLYSVGNGNIVTSNPVLSIAALQTAVTMLRKQLDSGGDPVVINGRIILRIGPDLEVTATNIINTLVARIKEAGGTSNQELEISNWIVRNITVSVDPYIPIVASSSNGTTTWALFADPREQNRPALELGQMRGFESPVLLEKAPETMRGGSMAPEFGSWVGMAREMKGMLVFGGAQINPASTVASNGSGV